MLVMRANSAMFGVSTATGARNAIRVSGVMSARTSEIRGKG